MSASNEENPFAQPAALTQLIFDVAAEHATMLELAFESMALAISSDAAQSKALVKLEILIDSADVHEVAPRMAIVREMSGAEIANPHVLAVVERDWVSEVQASFKPMRAGRFYIYGSHIATPPPQGSVPIVMDAGAAFGTGEHETTAGCMEALDVLARKRHFHRIADIGTGTGILAIAAAKQWKVPVIAVDLDPVAVRVSRGNVMDNRVRRWVQTEVSNGYQARHVNGQYDLIIANILARPLMVMARDLRKHLAPGGVAVLSGLLGSQERQVPYAGAAAYLTYSQGCVVGAADQRLGRHQMP